MAAHARPSRNGQGDSAHRLCLFEHCPSFTGLLAPTNTLMLHGKQAQVPMEAPGPICAAPSCNMIMSIMDMFLIVIVENRTTSECSESVSHNFTSNFTSSFETRPVRTAAASFS